jgi:hypothetical protein
MNGKDLGFIETLERHVQFAKAHSEVTLLEEGSYDRIFRISSGEIDQRGLQATPNTVS